MTFKDFKPYSSYFCKHFGEEIKQNGEQVALDSFFFPFYCILKYIGIFYCIVIIPVDNTLFVIDQHKQRPR